MEQILFRALNRERQWVYGFFTGTPDFISIDDNGECSIVKIDMETVSQHIGKCCFETDKPLFEGDILKCGTEMFFIEYDTFHCAFRLRSSFNYSGSREMKTGILVGNIYESPELITDDPVGASKDARTSTYEKWSKKNQREVFRQLGIK